MSKVVDLLEEDKPIAQQKFVCMSFVSPENVIKSKHEFFFEQFVKNYESKVPMIRMGHPKDISPAVSFLLS